MHQRRCLNCRALIPTGTRCGDCTRTHDRTRRPNANTRGYTWNYRKRRAELIGLPCVICGEPSDTADHVVPVSLGGSDGPLQPMCLRCNSARGNRPLNLDP